MILRRCIRCNEPIPDPRGWPEWRQWVCAKCKRVDLLHDAAIFAVLILVFCLGNC